MFFQATITLPISRMRWLISLINNIQDQAEERGMTDEVILSSRLAPDMFPFSKQIQIVSDNAKWMASRLAQKEAPKYEDNETSLDELKARLEKTISYLETFTEEDFVNAATAEARFPWYPDMKMVWSGYLLTYGLPNFFFHVVTAYNILRNAGFEIGKADFMAGEIALVPDVK